MLSLTELYLLSQDELFDYVRHKAESLSGSKLSFHQDPEAMWLACFPKSGKDFVPVLASHLDVLGGVPPEEIRYEETPDGRVCRGFCSGEPHILGGDDRNGVWAMLRLLEEGQHQLGYFFSREEEAGCLGARALVRSEFWRESTSRIGYFIQIDRRGTGDLAWYSLPELSANTHSNTLFQSRLAELAGYNFVRGSSTDIRIYCSSAKLCGINLSAGYSGEHYPGEATNLNYVAGLPQILRDMVKKLGLTRYRLEENSLPEE